MYRIIKIVNGLGEQRYKVQVNKWLCFRIWWHDVTYTNGYGMKIHPSFASLKEARNYLGRRIVRTTEVVVKHKDGEDGKI